MKEQYRGWEFNSDSNVSPILSHIIGSGLHACNFVSAAPPCTMVHCQMCSIATVREPCLLAMIFDIFNTPFK